LKTKDYNWLQIDAAQAISDGQTMVLTLADTNQPPDTRTLRLLFITPRLIDPTGNPIHSDVELLNKH
jgi:hypothetical protein